MNGSDLCRMSEVEARAFFESVRWPDGPVCPHCGCVGAYRLGGKAGAAGQLKCKACRKKFTVRVKSIMEDSPIALRDWAYAFTRMCASKKGISAHQLHRELGVTYKTAWFMCHRIRHAMADTGAIALGSGGGDVESDEAWIGGKPRKHNRKGFHKADGNTTPTTKTPVHTLVERNGKKRTRVLCEVTARNLKANLSSFVDTSATIHTDQAKRYRVIVKDFAAHKSVNHGIYEYYRREDGAGINTAESSFAIIKRGMYGTFHHCSKVHLQRYLDEFDFRWNHRDIDDVGRTVEAIKGAEGKRLTYQQPVA